jgi:hypothetical protein
MIVSETTWSNNDCSVDIGRPNFTCDKDRNNWKLFNETIEKSSVEVKVNAMYPSIKQMLDANQDYLGGGFRYMFWFKSPEDKIKIFEELKKALPYVNWNYYS